MRPLSTFALALGFFGVTAAATADGGGGAPADPAKRLRELREAGPAGLEALLAEHDEARLRDPDPALAAAIDFVAGQRDGAWSRLYWHGDLEQAKRAARESGRPLLSLRLLGALTDEYSCANSRFFRVALYANREVAAALRDGFVLHWTTERPAPRVTSDMGDGRKIVRTIAGNSIHYVLDADGRVVDAIPGLCGPGAFLRALAASGTAARGAGRLSGAEREGFLRLYHEVALRAGVRVFARDARAAGLAAATNAAQRTAPPAAAAPSAVPAGEISFAKTMVERPLLIETSLEPLRDAAAVTPAVEQDAWDRIGAIRAAEARLDDRSLALFRRKLAPGTDEAATLARFERTLAADGAHGEHRLRPVLHRWLAAPDAPRDLEALNARVYSELFLTPRGDAWLGLVEKDVFSALDRGGTF